MRKQKTEFIRKKIIFISIIISMSLIGVGYASWTDETTINLSVKTGFVKQSFNTENSKCFENGDIFFDVSNYGKTLNIKGDVYPEFNEDLTINIVDNGTVPSLITEVSGENNNISTLKGSFKNRAINNSYDFKKNGDSFKININPNNNHNELKQLNATNLNGDDIGNLENEVDFIKEKIASYDNKENYKFNYIISYELGSWKKKLYINGDINVIPDPKVLESRYKTLEKAQTKLDEKKEYEKQQQLSNQQRILLEQQKLQENKKLLELENDSLQENVEICSQEKSENEMNNTIQENLQNSTVENVGNSELEGISSEQNDDDSSLTEENSVENEEKTEKIEETNNEPAKPNNETAEPNNEAKETKNEEDLKENHESLDKEKEEIENPINEPSETNSENEEPIKEEDSGENHESLNKEKEAKTEKSIDEPTKSNNEAEELGSEEDSKDNQEELKIESEKPKTDVKESSDKILETLN